MANMNDVIKAMKNLQNVANSKNAGLFNLEGGRDGDYAVVEFTPKRFTFHFLFNINECDNAVKLINQLADRI